MAKRTFTASDWLAAIDGQLQAPPEPPTIDAEPPITDRGPWEATQPARATRRGLRNWHMATLSIAILVGLASAVFAAFDGPLILLVLCAAALSLELLIWFLLAWRYDRL